MSRHKYKDGCKGCEPVLIDPYTGKVSPHDSPEMQAMMRVWSGTTLEERQAWHRVTCLNSRDEKDLLVMIKLQEAFKRQTETN